MVEVEDIEVESDEQRSDEGFFRIRTTVLRNRRADGTRSPSYTCEFVTRPKGIDAVVVALYHRAAGRTQVLIREQLRPGLALGRDPQALPVPDGSRRLYFPEVVAGILEHEDRGEAGIRERAAIEVFEEAGFRVSERDVEMLGAGTFPSPGSMPEKFWLTAVHIADPASGETPQTDGSPMEEGARLRWMELGEAIEACMTGAIADAKTEIVLRRLADRVRDDAASLEELESGA